VSCYQRCDLVLVLILRPCRFPPSLDIQQKRIAAEGAALALSRQLTFDEDKVLRLVTPYIAASLNLPGGVQVIAQDVARTKVSSADEEGWKGGANIVESAEPGNPGILFWTRPT